MGLSRVRGGQEGLEARLSRPSPLSDPTLPGGTRCRGARKSSTPRLESRFLYHCTGQASFGGVPGGFHLLQGARAR